MKRIALLSAAIFTVAHAGHAGILLNETLINPSGTDDSREFVEIIRTNPGDVLTNVWLLEIETDSGTGRGTVDLALNLSSATFVNNMLVIGHNYATSNPYGLSSANVGLFNLSRLGATTMEQDVTLLLVTDFSGAVATDYDTNNDGTFDSTPWTAILDGVSIRAAGLPGYGVTPLEQTSGTADGASRFFGNVTPLSSPSEWYGSDVIDVLPTGGNDLTYDGTLPDRGFNLFPGAQLTPGEINQVPEPSAILAIGSGLVALGLIRRRR